MTIKKTIKMTIRCDCIDETDTVKIKMRYNIEKFILKK